MSHDVLRVDLERLSHLAGQLDGLAKTAATLEATPQEIWIGTPDPCLASLNTIIDITTDLLNRALVDAVTERFEETADIMRHTIVRYRNAEDHMVHQLAATYLSTTGDWTTADPK